MRDNTGGNWFVSVNNFDKDRVGLYWDNFFELTYVRPFTFREMNWNSLEIIVFGKLLFLEKYTNLGQWIAVFIVQSEYVEVVILKKYTLIYSREHYIIHYIINIAWVFERDTTQ